MGYIVSFILLFIAVFEYFEKKTWAAPSVIFSAFWAVISFAASLRLYNLNSVETKTWFIILIGVISFTLGTKIKVRGNTLEKTTFNTQASCISSKWFWILFVIACISLTGRVYQTFTLLKNDVPLYLIRQASFGLVELKGYTFDQGFFAVLIDCVITAVESLLIAVGIEYFLKNPQKNWIYVLASFILVIEKSFYSGGRWILAYFIIEFFVCKKILNHQDKTKRIIISSKAKRNGLFLSFAFIIAIIFVFARISDERDIENMGRHLYTYLCGCVPFLDVKICDIDHYGIYSFVYAGFYGLWYYILIAIQKLTGSSFLLQSEALKIVMSGQESRNIGAGMFNAFTTCFYYLYADYRFIGVFLGMLLFGAIAGNLFRIAKLKQNSYALISYLFITQMIISSVQTYPFTSSDNVFALITMAIIYIVTANKFKIK